MNPSYVEFCRKATDADADSLTPEEEWRKFIVKWEKLPQPEALALLRRISDGEPVVGFTAFKDMYYKTLRAWGSKLISDPGVRVIRDTDQLDERSMLLSIPFSVHAAREQLLRSCFSKIAVEAKLVTPEILSSDNWLSAFVCDCFAREFETSPFLWDARTAHRIALCILMKSENCDRWLNDRLSQEQVGQAIVFALHQGRFDMAKGLLTSRMIKSPVPTEIEMHEHLSEALETAARQNKRLTKKLIDEWKGSILDPECIPAPSADLEAVALRTLAALGEFKFIPEAAFHDQRRRKRTASSPDTGLVWNRAEGTSGKFETVDVMRLDTDDGESFAVRFDTISQFTERRAFYQAVDQVRAQIGTSSRVRKVCARRQLVLNKIIDDPELSSAEIARELRTEGIRTSDDTIEDDHYVVNEILRQALKDFVSS